MNALTPGLTTCPECERPFLPRRKDMRFCHANCRKAHSRKQNSHPIFGSRAKRRHNTYFFDTARRMGETYYSLPVTERLGHIKALVDEARAGNTQLRELLSNRKLMHLHPKNDKWMFPRGHPSYSTIAQIAQAYCWRFWRANVGDVVHGRVPEPPTGEVFPEVTTEEASHHI